MEVRITMSKAESKNQPENRNTEPKNSKSNTEEQYEFSNLNNEGIAGGKSNIEFILDLPLNISVELGQTKMRINELLKLGQGSIIELTKSAGTSLDILANKKLIARGEVVIVNDKYGVRLTEIVSPSERVEILG